MLRAFLFDRQREAYGMNFLAPALLLGLLAAVLPWIIHRIGRRRARPVRFAAMELLLRAEREVSARRQAARRRCC